MDDRTLSLSRAWQGDVPELRKWGPFELLARVGRGGFGEVYRAFDPALQREVAVKLLLPSGDRREEQLAAILRESRAMARVIHPNVVPVYGVTTYDGRVGFWSAFVRGKTLSALIDSNGPFGAREVINIGVDLCRALSAVHAAGLLHRDIKAGNAMREEGGRILLMDFGLTQEHDGQASFDGTEGYIAPELKTGAKATVRSDLFALGVLLYHLLTNKYPPADAGTTWTLFEQRSDLPPGLVRAIHTAIEPDPGKRFASAAQMAAALSEASGESGWPSSIPAPTASNTTRRHYVFAAASVAVTVVVIWAAAYAVRSHWPRGAESAAPPGIHQRYDKAHDLLQHYYRPHALETAIPMLESIVREEPSFAAGFADLGRANFMQFWQLRDSKYVEPARKASLEAIAIDGNQASAHVTLAMLYTQLGNNDLAAQELDTALRVDRVNADAWAARAELYLRQGRTEDVEPALRKAIDLDPSNWRGPKQLADYYGRTGRRDLAIESDRASVLLAPDNARAYNNLGLDLWYAGRLEEARAALQKALDIEPGYNRYSNLGLVQLDLGDYAAAIGLFGKAIALNPNDYRAWGLLAGAYRRTGTDPAKVLETYRKSIALGEELRKSRPRETALLADLGMMYAATGDFAKSVPLARQAAALDPGNGEVLFMTGVVYESMHRRAEAIQWIGAALHHGYSIKSVEHDPDLASLRSDKNYLAMTASLR